MQFSATFKKYFANTSWLFAEKILRMGISFFVGVWVARYLGPERLGLLSYAQSFVFLFSAFATLGLDGIVVRELVKTPKNRDVLLGTSFTLKLIGSFITLILLGSALVLTKADGEIPTLMLLIGSSTIFQSFNVIDFYFQSKVQSKYVVFAQAISMVVVNLLKVGLILYEAPLVWFGGIIAFETIFTAKGLIGYYRKTGMKLFQWHFNQEIAKSLLKDSWPLILSGIMVSLYMKIDQVMITHMLGEEANGQYAAAVKLSELWYFIPIVITNSLFPAIISVKDSPELPKKMTILYRYLIIIAVGVAIFFTLWGRELTQTLYGAEFNFVASVLGIHIWSGIFVSIGVASSKWLITNNFQTYGTINTTIGVILNICLNFFLLRIYGINGAAIATFVSYSIAAYGLLILNKKTRPNFMYITKAFNPIRLRYDKKYN